MTVGVHRGAAAGTTVADGVKAAYHGVFKKSVMHMPAFIFCFNDFHGLI
jgi:hypothetical protein